MNNINRKKLVRRLAKSSVKEFPLTNLYILVLIIAGVFVELTDSNILRWLYRPLALSMMIYYIHNKASALDYLVCNLTEVGLIFAIVGDCIRLYGEQQTEVIQQAFTLIGVMLYIVVFNMKQLIGLSSAGTKAILFGSCLAVTSLQSFVVYSLWESPYRNLASKVLLSILLMSAILRYNKTSPRSYLFLLISAGLIAGSELTVTGLKHFDIQTNFVGVLEGPIVMLGHYLIMHGAILHCNLQDAIEKLRYRSTY